MRLRIVLAVAGVAALVVAAVGVVPAQATSFRYWSYWTGTADGWQFSSRGPAFRAAQESVVEGWRLAVTDVQGTVKPRFDSPQVYARACDGTAPEPGRLRIAVVIDFGTAADALAGDAPLAPVLACAVVDDGATGFDALIAVSDLRTESGMVCGIDGYPSSGCGRDPVESESGVADERTPTPEVTPRDTAAASPGPSARENSPRATETDGGSPQTSAPEDTPTRSASANQHATTANTSSSAMRASTPTPRASPESSIDTSPTGTAAADEEGSGGPFIAGLVLIFLVLLTSMGWLRARRRR